MDALHYIIVVFTVLLQVACSGKDRQKDMPASAIHTVESVREQWHRSRKLPEIFIENISSASLQRMGQVGVYSLPGDATLDEQAVFSGIPFCFEEEKRFLPEDTTVLTGDSLATWYVCYPYVKGIGVEDSLALRAPFGEMLYGTEISRRLNERYAVHMRLNHAVSLLRLRLETTSLTDILHHISLSGDGIYTRADYFPYQGRWANLSGENVPISYAFDRMMNNYQYVDMFLPPVNRPNDISLAVRMNERNYYLQTTLPRLGRGEMTQLNLSVEDGRLKILSSWIKERTDILFPETGREDSVRVGDYLQRDGTVRHERDTASVALVFHTDGRHGTAVALTDEPGIWRFSSRKISSGKIFPTVDGKRTEGIINPLSSDGVDEAERLVYKPSLLYPESCAFGYKGGCVLSMALLKKQLEKNTDDMLLQMEIKKGSFIPSVADWAELYYLLQAYEGNPLQGDYFEMPEGEYLTSCEASASTFYMFDCSHGVITGTFSKQYARLKLRLFYVF